MNSENKNEFEIVDTMTATAQISLKNECADTGKIWKKNCPKCGKEQVYRKISNYNKAVKLERQCRTCMFKSKEYKNIHRQNTSEMWRNEEKKKYILARRTSPASIEKWKNSTEFSFCNSTYREKQKHIQIDFLKTHPEKVETQRLKMKKLWEDQSSVYYSENFREKLRESRIKQIQKLGVLYSNYNPIACRFFDELNNVRGWNLQHAENGGEIKRGGYFLDAYDEKRKIVVEYDEPQHYDYRGQLRAKDIIRQGRIIQRVNPILFLRYNEKETNLYEVTIRKEG